MVATVGASEAEATVVVVAMVKVERGSAAVRGKPLRRWWGGSAFPLGASHGGQQQ